MTSSANSTAVAKAKRAVAREGVTRSNLIRIAIAESDPVSFLISVMKGDVIEQVIEKVTKDGNGEAIAEQRTVRRAAGLTQRIGIAEFLSNKVVANIAPQSLDTDPSDSDAAKWAKALAELPETQDVYVAELGTGQVTGVEIEG